MSTPANPTQKAPAGSSIPEIVPPKCPHCAQPIPNIGTYAYTAGDFAILCLYCPYFANCGKVIHFQIFQKPGEPQRIVDPS